MNSSKPSSTRQVDDTQRLIRIETKLAKIMLALGLDPLTGESLQPKKPTNPLRRIFNDY
jgi:hypothetical protein